VRAVSRLCEFYPGICLTTEEKARKPLSQGKTLQNPQKHTPTHYKILKNTHYTHTLQNPHNTKHPHNTKSSQTHITKHPHITKPSQTHYKTPTQYKTLTNTHYKTPTHNTKQYKTTTVQIKTKCI